MHSFHHRKYYDESDSTSEQHIQSLLFVLYTDEVQHASLFFFFPYWSCMLNLAQWNVLDGKFFWCIYLFQIKLMLTTALWVQEFGNGLDVADSFQEDTIQIRLVHWEALVWSFYQCFLLFPWSRSEHCKRSFWCCIRLLVSLETFGRMLYHLHKYWRVWLSGFRPGCLFFNSFFLLEFSVVIG